MYRAKGMAGCGSIHNLVDGRPGYRTMGKSLAWF